jgi:glycosyltransferase involved in cell wall biosynthesis
VSTWSEINPYRNGRRYVLSLPDSTGVARSSSAASWNGTLRRGYWNESHPFRSIQKAKRAGYKTLVLPESMLSHPLLERVLQNTFDFGLDACLQISHEKQFHFIKKILHQYPVHFERWIDQDLPDWSVLQDIQKTRKVSLQILGLKSNHALREIHKIPSEFQAETEFYFPYFADKKKKLSAKDIMIWQEFLSKKSPSVLPRPSSGVDIYEPRIPDSADLEPMHDPVYSSLLPETPKISVIIPVYNNGFYLLNTLRHLEKQATAKTDYEVIIVDDGSTDRISESLVELVADLKMQITLLYYPRLKKRAMGDSQFRAGLARNYGVKFARGKTIVFLDSDILVPANFIQKTEQLHELHQVVQWRREYLHKNIPCASFQYEEVDVERHCYIPERGYWHQFYEEAKSKGWEHLADGWKYACTYAFSVPKSVFEEAGWFRKTFCFYGLEDTDLGWRLQKGGYRFYLEQTPVYHLFHEDIRSEFSNSSFRRQKLLKTTAEIFFHNNLSPDIYRVFQYLFNSWLF